MGHECYLIQVGPRVSCVRVKVHIGLSYILYPLAHTGAFIHTDGTFYAFIHTIYSFKDGFHFSDTGTGGAVCTGTGGAVCKGATPSVEQ
jgi:hypothetical protein